MQKEEERVHFFVISHFLVLRDERIASKPSPIDSQ